MRFSMVILLVLFFFMAGNCEDAQDWKKIVPLRTTRAEVEAIFGVAAGTYEVVYQFKSGHLSVEYSSGPCRPERKGGWNVPENVVISVHFSPKNPKRLAQLKLDPKKFRQVVGGDVPGVEYYVNDENGITYAIQQGKVDWVEYGPPKKYDYLYCKDRAANEVRRAPKKP